MMFIWSAEKSNIMNSSYRSLRLIFIVLLPMIPFISSCQPGRNEDSAMIREIYNYELMNGSCYRNLSYLCNTIGARLTGSPQAEQAVQWTKQLMESYGFDTVYLQPVMVPHWVRGDTEIARIISGDKEINVNLTSLGNSVGTGDKGVKAGIVEVKSLDELDSIGSAGIRGKIVFFNGRMDPRLINTGHAYGLAGVQRNHGPARAAKYGAVGVVVRSLTTRLDHIPHTGATSYEEGVPKIPAIAISTLDAEMLDSLLKVNPSTEFFFENHCRMLDDVLSHNVVGELKGSEYPDQIIDIGGHLDSWDLAQGAHDDGTGVVQSIEVLKIFKSMNYHPHRTIRAVLFMNEENGLRGGRKYGELAVQNNETHIAAIETDSGGMSPQGFGMDAAADKVNKLESWAPLFRPYGLWNFSKGEGGADISSLKRMNVPLIGFRPDTQKYFKYHHTPIDRFDKVDERELELGAAAITSLVYLIDQYGL